MTPPNRPANEPRTANGLRDAVAEILADADHPQCQEAGSTAEANCIVEGLFHRGWHIRAEAAQGAAPLGAIRAEVIRLLRDYAFADEGRAERCYAAIDRLDEGAAPLTDRQRLNDEYMRGYNAAGALLEGMLAIERAALSDRAAPRAEGLDGAVAFLEREHWRYHAPMRGCVSPCGWRKATEALASHPADERVGEPDV